MGQEKEDKVHNPASQNIWLSSHLIPFRIGFRICLSFLKTSISVAVQLLSHVWVCLSPSSRACSNSCPLSRWCYPTILSSVVPFSYLQSFPSSPLPTSQSHFPVWNLPRLFTIQVVLPDHQGSPCVCVCVCLCVYIPVYIPTVKREASLNTTG